MVAGLVHFSDWTSIRQAKQQPPSEAIHSRYFSFAEVEAKSMHFR